MIYTDNFIKRYKKFHPRCSSYWSVCFLIWCRHKLPLFQLCSLLVRVFWNKRKGPPKSTLYMRQPNSLFQHLPAKIKKKAETRGILPYKTSPAFPKSLNVLCHTGVQLLHESAMKTPAQQRSVPAATADRCPQLIRCCLLGQ